MNLSTKEHQELITELNSFRKNPEDKKSRFSFLKILTDIERFLDIIKRLIGILDDIVL